MKNGPGGYPLYDFTSSGLVMSYPIESEPNRWRVGDDVYAQQLRPRGGGLDAARPQDNSLSIHGVSGKPVLDRILSA
jgi:hypothetical protein